MIDDLSTYELSHFLPFTREVYERLFTLHNEAWWPAQLIALLCGLALVWRSQQGDGRAAAALLGIAWAFVGGAFFFDRYAELVWVGPWIGGAFFVQAGMLLVVAARDQLELDGAIAAVGSATVLVGWPLLAPVAGRAWSGIELFAITPDPTAIVTLAVLLGAARGQPLLWPIPLLWCAISAATSWTLELYVGVVPLSFALVCLIGRIVRSRP